MGTPVASTVQTSVASAAQESYFGALEREAKRALQVARTARSQGWDPALDVEIVLAEDLAARVEAQTELPGIARLVRDLTANLQDRELVALEASRRVARGELRAFPNPSQAIDKAVRVGLSILTEGVLVAPLEGIAKVQVGQNGDGTSYCDVYFAGPIRAAGGTAQAMSVLLADVVRRDLGIGRYVPTEAEIERYKEEVPAYKRAQHLQYVPDGDEIELIVRNCPICINGEGTEKVEVTGHRDLSRVETNQLRGGAVLVLAEGLTQKAAKVMKHVGKLGLQDWEFLQAFAKKKSALADEGFHEIESSDKFIRELIAGRPVFAHPSRPGGFRLRYGRGRTCGIASTAIHPVVMFAVDEFLAVGTQLKLERPGKGTIATPCESLDGPMVLLTDGELRRVDTVDNWRQLKDRVRQITDLGDILIPFGEFAENNAVLPDATFTIEWWRELVRARAGDAVAEHLCRQTNPPFEQAMAWSRDHAVPLHPHHTLLWHDVALAETLALAQRIGEFGRWSGGALEWPRADPDKAALIALACPHRERNGRLVVEELGATLAASLGLRVEGERLTPASAEADGDFAGARFPALAWVARNLGVEVKPRAPSRVGARMGRPEKADVRKMDPPVHGLFPLGDAGGLHRDLLKAVPRKLIEVEIAHRKCRDCGRDGPWSRCGCGGHTDEAGPPEARKVALAVEYEAALTRLKIRPPDEVKGVKGLISRSKTPEALAKGILRAQHEVFTFKDGTIRFDLTDAPLTHFRPAEIGTSVARLRELGYERDIAGKPLERPDQLLELRVQDVIPARRCGEYFVRVARYVDDLLVHVYGLEPFYEVGRSQDLVGHLVAGLAPHTSGAILGRIIGFTDSLVCWAHPFFHTGKRRNCLDPSTELFVLNSPQPKRLSMQALFESLPGPSVVQDDVGTHAKNAEGLHAWAVDPASGMVEPRRISRVYRVPSPRHLLRLTTKSGRAITCSPDHRLYVASSSGLRKQRALEAKMGDNLVFARRIPQRTRKVGRLDLLEELEAQPFEGLVVRGLGRWLPKQIERLGGLARCASEIGISMKSLDNYRRRDSLPWPLLFRLLQRLNLSSASLPGNVRLATLRDTVEIPRWITVGPELARLVGYYIAEGYARGRPGHWFQVSIATTETEMAEDVIRCLKNVFGVSALHNGTSVTASSRVLHHLFTRILNLGSNAHEKRIPPRLAALPSSLTRQLLAAYFSGDGSVESGRLHVTCHSVSKTLLMDIGYQLALRGIAYRIGSENRIAGGAVRRFYERKGRKLRRFKSYRLSIRSSHASTFAREIGFSLSRKQNELARVLPMERQSRFRRGPGSLVLDPIRSIKTVRSRSKWLYDLEVEGHHNFLIADQTLVSNCDGDEDALILLMDAFLNFSKSFIPDRRGGLMDLPLVLSLRIDPREIDKEAHNLDTLWRYPLEFYEATERHATAKEIAKKMGLVEARLGTPAMYEGFGLTHDTPTIQEGPRESSYKRLGSMIEKMERQLALAERLRAVDAGDVAGRVLSTHLLPDILGNLKAFAKQTVRCTKCNTKYRRVPLAGKCTHRTSEDRVCGNDLILTVPQAGVRKYLDLSLDIARRYPVPEYTKERVKLAQRFVEASFAPERLRTTRLGEFA